VAGYPRLLRPRTLPLTLAALLWAGAAAHPALAVSPPERLSTDPYTTATTSVHHATEVEPDSFSFGSKVVSAFQVGRFEDGGAANLGWAASTDSGHTWTKDKFLTGITTQAGGTFARVTDPSVAYDAKDGVWLIGSVPLDSTEHGAAVVVNRSTDDLQSWGSPVTVAAAAGSSDFDKDWIVCDNTATSPYYGRCYAQWDDFGNSNTIKMSTSKDGGKTWSAPANTTGNAPGLGGQPLVQPNGTVIVPMAAADETTIQAFRSTNGGDSWTAPVFVGSVFHHTVAGQIRASALPSAEIDGGGKVYVTWEDCRFRLDCSTSAGANDIVMSTSADGVTWSAVSRVPIDPTNSGVDHFVPGLGVDPLTSGAGAHLALAYHYLPDTACGGPTACELDVGFVSSLDGGAHWSTPQRLAGPMTVSWLVPTTQGFMFGDYISTSFTSGSAHPVFALAAAQPTATTFDEAIYASSPALDASPGQPPNNPPPVTPPPVVPPAGPPVLTQLGIAPARFPAARHGPSIATASGAMVSYSASTAGSTSFTVKRLVIRHGSACGFHSRSARNRRCRRWVAVPGSFQHADSAGLNRFRFAGRLQGHRLVTGVYLLAALPHNPAGTAGQAKHARFTVISARAARARRASAR
jgi:hypothetical protein